MAVSICDGLHFSTTSFLIYININRTCVSNVMVVRICVGIPYQLSSAMIYIMWLNWTSESKLLPVGICPRLPCLNLSVSIGFRPYV